VEIVEQPEGPPFELGKAVEALRAGLLVGVPTETVYGLAADAANPDAIARIYAAKRRPTFNPLIIHAGSEAEATTLGQLGTTGAALADAFWPGALTVVAEQKSTAAVADLATAGLDTIALRVPSHPVMRALLAEFGGPLAAPSANISGTVSATTAAHVAADLDEDVAVVLDAGPAPLGLESTIVSVTGEPRILRPGAISREAIEDVLKAPLPLAGEDDAPSAPGMLSSHYAPTVPLRMGAEDVRPGESLLAFGPRQPAGWEGAVATENLSTRAELREAAANLFAALRRLDEVGAPIAVAPIPLSGLGLAINDRLRRAAAPRQS